MGTSMATASHYTSPATGNIFAYSLNRPAAVFSKPARKKAAQTEISKKLHLAHAYKLMRTYPFPVRGGA